MPVVRMYRYKCNYIERLQPLQCQSRMRHAVFRIEYFAVCCISIVGLDPHFVMLPPPFLPFCITAFFIHPDASIFFSTTCLVSPFPTLQHPRSSWVAGKFPFFQVQVLPTTVCSMREYNFIYRPLMQLLDMYIVHYSTSWTLCWYQLLLCFPNYETVHNSVSKCVLHKKSLTVSKSKKCLLFQPHRSAFSHDFNLLDWENILGFFSHYFFYR